MLAAKSLRAGISVALAASLASGCTSGSSGSAAATTSPSATTPPSAATTVDVPEFLTAQADGDVLVVRLENPRTATILFWAYLNVWEDDEMIGRIGLTYGNPAYGFIPGAQRTQNSAGLMLEAGRILKLPMPLPTDLVGRTVTLTGRVEGVAELRYELTVDG